MKMKSIEPNIKPFRSNRTMAMDSLISREVLIIYKFWKYRSVLVNVNLRYLAVKVRNHFLKNNAHCVRSVKIIQIEKLRIYC